MKSAIADLRARLVAINLHSERQPLRIDISGMAAERRKIEALANLTANGAGASKNRIITAIEAFRQTGELADVRAARLVCWGIIEHTTDESTILIEDSDRFDRLLKLVDAYRSEQRPYRRCWRGLLHGYLAYDHKEHAPGRANWQSLRDYLADTRHDAISGQLRPDWAVTIAEHPNLLTNDPCSRYARAVFEGDDAIVAPLRLSLGLNDDMWLSRALVEAQLADALSRPDTEFKQIVPKLLTFLGRYQNLQEQGLARILNRYAEIADPGINIELRDYTISLWGNPWLQTNALKWGKVSDAGRKMVSSWLKLEFIRAFFELLSSDKINDQRRLRFWEKYVDDIDDMYFALGNTAIQNNRPDFIKSRKAMSGRLINLEQAGSPDNNAFVMMIKDHVFVEFGEKGNALYIFKRDSIPFDLSRNSISGNTSLRGLKSPAHVDRLRHVAKNGGQWEDHFAHTIRRLTGIYAQQGTLNAVGLFASPHPPRRANSVSTKSTLTQGQSIDKSPADDPEFLSEKLLHWLLSKNKMEFTDNRQKGGACWVHVPNSGDERSILLKDWGFIWSEKRQAWYRTS
jgi:hypothetical protein